MMSNQRLIEAMRLMTAGAGQRLVIAGVLGVLIWAGFFWATGSMGAKP